jgi:3,4-dihydroxy 2-butanone 4-phosphate synthase/GTP cyclohydrolase II
MAADPEEPIGRAIEALRAEQTVLMLDGDGGAASVGAAIMAAELLDAPTLLAFSQRAPGSYLALTDERCEALGLEVTAERDDALASPPLTVTIAARDSVSHGVSIVDRLNTIRVASDPAYGPGDLRYGGNVRPLRARPGGVLERAGFTEASIDLLRFAGLRPAAVQGEILRPDGELARGAELREFARREHLPVVTIAEVIARRRQTERLVTRLVTTRLETTNGTYQAYGYRGELDGTEHMALVHGDVVGRADVPVYIHMACWEGGAFGSLRCDCRARLDAAQAHIRASGCGVVVHLAHPEHHRHQQRAPDDQIRDFGVGAQILVDLGLTTIAVLTDHARPLSGLAGFGLTVSEHRPLLSAA